MLWTCLLLLFAYFTVANGQTFLNSSGASGPLCGRSRCIAAPTASCIDRTCVCGSIRSKGLGTFICELPDTHVCALYNDPKILAFNGEYNAGPLPGVFLIAHTRTSIYDYGRVKVNGECITKAYAHAKKVRGKLYVGGVLLDFRLTIDNVIYSVFYYLSGSAKDGLYQHFSVGGVGNDTETVSFENLVLAINGLSSRIYNRVDETNNINEIYAEMCGIRCGVRPFDATRRFEQVPGVYFVVDSKHYPQFLDVDQALCLSPDVPRDSLKGLSIYLSNLVQLKINQRVALLYKMLTQTGIPEEYLQGGPPSLPEASALGRSCPAVHLVTGLYYCIFLVENPRLVYCLDPSDIGEVLTRLVVDCLSIFCLPGDPSKKCPVVKSSINAGRCYRHIPSGEVSIFDFDCP